MKRKVGLVLGGGGARGFFHMGVIKAIQEMGIEISEVSGTSIGAIVGIMYAGDPSVNFEKLASEVNFLELISAVGLGTNKKFNQNLEKFIRNYIKVSTFEELKIKARFNATDINNNQEIVFEEGDIFPGLIASISVPGVFPPCKYNETYLVDGGIMNTVPVPLIENADKIIVSDICGPIKPIEAKSPPMEILYTSIALMQRNMSLLAAKEMEKKLIYLTLDDTSTFILDFRKKNYQYLIDLGYKAMMDRKEELEEKSGLFERLFKA